MERGHFDTRRATRLNNAERLKELRPQQLLTEVGRLTLGMTCVDLGSGTGVFAIPMAEIVGESGKVFAVDNSRDMLDYISAQASPQIALVEADASRTGLPGGIADVCLAAFLLHETASPSEVVAEAFRLLKTGGSLLIVEWRIDARIGPPADIRISPEKARQLLMTAGFASGGYRVWSENHYVICGAKSVGPDQVQPMNSRNGE